MPRAVVDLGSNTIRFTDGDPGGIAGQLARVSEAWAQAVPQMNALKMRQDEQAYQKTRDEQSDTRYAGELKMRQEDQEAQRRTEWSNEYRDLDTHIGEAQRRRMSDIALRREAVAAARAGRSPKQFDPALYGQEITAGSEALGTPRVKSHGLNPARAKELDSLIYSARVSGNQELLRQIQAAYPDAHASGMLAALPEGNEVSDKDLAASDYGVAPTTLSASEKAYLQRYTQDPRTAKYIAPEALNAYRQMYDPVQQDVVTDISGAAPAPPAAPAAPYSDLKGAGVMRMNPNATLAARGMVKPQFTGDVGQVIPRSTPAPSVKLPGAANAVNPLDVLAALADQEHVYQRQGRDTAALRPKDASFYQTPMEDYGFTTGDPNNSRRATTAPQRPDPAKVRAALSAALPAIQQKNPGLAEVISEQLSSAPSRLTQIGTFMTGDTDDSHLLDLLKNFTRIQPPPTR